MTKDKNIFILNIYYMLTYAFRELKQNNYEEIAGENFDNIQQLFAEILIKGISCQLKQGIFKQYIIRKDSLPTLRGKLDLNATIQNKLCRKQEIGCEVIGKQHLQSDYKSNCLWSSQARKHQKRSKDQAKESHAVLFRHRHHRTKHDKMEYTDI